MSKNINVNPDHYKVAGRERQGENVVHQVEKSKERRNRTLGKAKGKREKGKGR
jgi:hypothetical protein